MQIVTGRKNSQHTKYNWKLEKYVGVGRTEGAHIQKMLPTSKSMHWVTETLHVPWPGEQTDWAGCPDRLTPTLHFRVLCLFRGQLDLIVLKTAEYSVQIIGRSQIHSSCSCCCGNSMDQATHGRVTSPNWGAGYTCSLSHCESATLSYHCSVRLWLSLTH